MPCYETITLAIIYIRKETSIGDRKKYEKSLFIWVFTTVFNCLV